MKIMSCDGEGDNINARTGHRGKGCKASPMEDAPETQRRGHEQFADLNPDRISKHGS